MILLYSFLSTVQFLWKRNFSTSRDGLLAITSFKLMFLKLKNLYSDVHLLVTLLHHNLCRLLNRLWSLNFLEFIFLQPFPPLHTTSTSLLLLTSECTYLQSWRIKGCRMLLYIAFTAIILSVVICALPSYAGQWSKGDKARLDSLFRKAFRRGFCFQTFSIEEFISAADKKLFRQII